MLEPSFTSCENKVKMKCLGFTLIEILVSISILGILTAIAIPQFNNLIKRWHIEAIRDELIASLQWARSEAIVRGTNVILVRNTSNCIFELPDTRDWHCGWRAVLDTNNNGNANVNEEIIQRTTLSAGYMLVHRGGSPDKIIVTRTGQFVPLAHRFIILPDATGVSDQEIITLCISSGVRIRYFKDEVECPL
jgi:type IV fimbrial biogenesis protein FimT